MTTTSTKMLRTAVPTMPMVVHSTEGDSLYADSIDHGVTDAPYEHRFSPYVSLITHSLSSLSFDRNSLHLLTSSLFYNTKYQTGMTLTVEPQWPLVGQTFAL